MPIVLVITMIISSIAICKGLISFARGFTYCQKFINCVLIHNIFCVIANEMRNNLCTTNLANICLQWPLRMLLLSIICNGGIQIGIMFSYPLMFYVARNMMRLKLSGDILLCTIGCSR
jgi:hypothetical protein